MRSLLAALLGWPVSRIVRLTLEPDDILVLESERHLSGQELANLRGLVSGAFPGRQVIILEDRIRLQVLAPAAAGAALMTVLDGRDRG